LYLAACLLVLLLSVGESFAQLRSHNESTDLLSRRAGLSLSCTVKAATARWGASPLCLLKTYEETRPFQQGVIARRNAGQIHAARWFADPKSGQFSNDPSLKPAEIRTLAAWVDAKSTGRECKGRSVIPALDRRLGSIPKAGFDTEDCRRRWPLPAERRHRSTPFAIVPTNFQGRNRLGADGRRFCRGSVSNVHHACCVCFAPPDSNWLRHAPVGVPFTASMLSDPPRSPRRLTGTGTATSCSSIAPGSSPDAWPEKQWRNLSPAGSRPCFFRYTTTPPNGRAAFGNNRVLD